MKYYTANGAVAISELQAIAKNNDTTYWIKRTPLGFFYDPTNHMHQKAMREDRLNYKFEKVSADVFEMYISYLNTKNPARLRLTERFYNESQIDRSR